MMASLSRGLAGIALGLLLVASAASANRPAPNAVIVFAPGADSVAVADDATLRQLSAEAKSGEAKWISLEAYADDQGSRELNLALAQRRIEDVSHHLIALGFPSNRIRGTSYGDEHMDESDLPMRRVEIRINNLRR
ncbi:MAG: OmpA family protein [Sulfuritalea sp.]|jgi:outer membrane protein OmpA-like peptidoglycan-associated protein|nr:OmpA family protein [Sulfuritalea sp.]